MNTKVSLYDIVLDIKSVCFLLVSFCTLKLLQSTLKLIDVAFML